MADVDHDQAEQLLPLAFEAAAPAELDELAAAGWGEGDHLDPHVPGDVLAALCELDPGGPA